MGSKHRRITRKTDVVTQEVDKELLVYDMGNHKAFCLNETSALVYQLCDGEVSASGIADRMAVKLKRPVSEDLVWLAIDQLKKEELLDVDQELEARFEGPSRREVIRKIGLASMIALPLVTGMIAPRAANAASACAPSACFCAAGGPVPSCVPAPGTCQNACVCQIANPGVDCVDNGLGSFTCTGTCG